MITRIGSVTHYIKLCSYLIIGLAICGVQSSQAQTASIPSVVPPPADAANLGRYGDVPVNLSVGLPNINIPIYSIKTPRLEVPINLSYYASGVKVDDIASWVGLGWALNAGGVITRSVRDLDDFSANNKGYYNQSIPLGDTLNQAYDWQYMDNVSNGLLDTEPDYFFYNFLNYTGKYILGQSKNPLVINYQDPLQVQFNPTSTTFTVLDGKGNQYLFAAKETTTSYYTQESNDPFPNHDLDYISSWYLSTIISFDKSDTITFNYYTDQLLQQTFDNFSEGIGVTYACPAPQVDMTSFPVESAVSHDGLDVLQSESFLNSSPLRLQEIDFRNGKVSFYSSETRTDISEAKLDSIVVYHYDPEFATYDILKRVKFSYDYFVTNFNIVDPVITPSLTNVEYRLRLDSVNMLGANNENGGKYSFLYDSTMLPLIQSNAKDLFNYYNGKIYNTTLVPLDTVNYQGLIYYIGAADRSTNPDSIQAGILKHIYYPTGGRTDFAYEPNSYIADEVNAATASQTASARGNTGQQMGAIGQTDTIEFIAGTSASATYNATISSYNYPGISTRPFVSFIDLTSNTTIYLNGAASPTAGVTASGPTNLVQGHTYQLIADAYSNASVSSSMSVSWTYNDTSHPSVLGGGLRIKQITDYDYSGQFLKSNVYKYGTAENGYGNLPSPTYLFNTNSSLTNLYLGCLSESGACTSVTYSRNTYSGYSIYDVFDLSSAPLDYPEVAKYQTDSMGNTLGKTIFDYSLSTNGILPVSSSYNNGVYVTNSAFIGGQLTAQSDYAYNSGSYWPVRRTYIGYENMQLQQGRGVKVNYVYSPTGCYTVGPAGQAYYAFDYPLYTGTMLPQGQTTYEYNINDTTKYLTKTSQYVYDNLDHLQPTRIVDYLSDGTYELTVNRYPEDADSISGLPSSEIAAVDTLISRHNITSLIQSQAYRNSTPVSLTRTDYSLWQNSLDLPDSIEAQNAANPIEKRVQFYNYDNNGSVLQDAKSSDAFHSYIWDYNRAYPIAEVANAAQSDIAYTSFEADGSGNWTIPDTTRNRTSGGITGNQSYNLTSTNSINKSGLNTAATYIISYWGYTGNTAKVNSISGMSKIALGNWTYYEDTVKGAAIVTISGTGLIDELRLYPKGSIMTTYAYAPLIGITSKCDPSSRLIYYTYDGLGRLKLVKDQYGNILKRYDYEYQTTNQ